MLVKDTGLPSLGGLEGAATVINCSPRALTVACCWGPHLLGAVPPSSLVEIWYVRSPLLAVICSWHDPGLLSWIQHSKLGGQCSTICPALMARGGGTATPSSVLTSLKSAPLLQRLQLIGGRRVVSRQH